MTRPDAGLVAIAVGSGFPAKTVCMRSTNKTVSLLLGMARNEPGALSGTVPLAKLLLLLLLTWLR
jgi:hypothetical protein